MTGSRGRNSPFPIDPLRAIPKTTRNTIAATTHCRESSRSTRNPILTATPKPGKSGASVADRQAISAATESVRSEVDRRRFGDGQWAR